jgi:hypothetical protein
MLGHDALFYFVSFDNTFDIRGDISISGRWGTQDQLKQMKGFHGTAISPPRSATLRSESCNLRSKAELAAASSGAEQSVASKESLASEEQVKRGDRCEHQLLLDAPP